MLLHLVVGLLLIGVILWAVQAFPAIDPTIKQIIRILVIVFAVIWLLGLLVPSLGFGHYLR